MNDIPVSHEYIATFGFGQLREGCYVKVKAYDREAAMKAMTARYDNEWSMLYDSAEDAGVERWGLKYVGWIDARMDLFSFGAPVIPVLNSEGVDLR